MIKFLIPLILLVIAFIMARRYIASSHTAEQKKSRQITVALMVFAIVMILLAIIGRMHWLGAALAALAPLIRIAVASAMGRFGKTTSTAETSNNKISEEEALQILGLKKPFTQEEVIDAHRKLMQKFHPDRGGNDYLAARINEAKEFLSRNG